ncbi:hypothetical protein BpHYR1_009899 [Brachionus plicatilis]|uniref:Uncharacterized protein n=1 Tax=Brachionus plicatilis TaxID=10195 RepID=A0A3M7QJY7_BRAPC|nr:hypothetical protein BpHYR1_009899 [Brachionus plicatilis]
MGNNLDRSNQANQPDQSSSTKTTIKVSYRFLNLLTESASMTVAGRAFRSLTILLVNVFAL